ncbi:MAG: hypothetical protein JSW58_04520 [Candidatus Latescibacterota bacterium]|nr:MAG: hypothetical protein JSW58_04520 [Candidatus Latescibacterota bacterium]
MRKILGVCLCAVIALSSPAWSDKYEERELKLKMIETDEVRVVLFEEEHAAIVPHLVRCFKNSYKFHTSLFDWTPTEKVTVMLRDFNDYGYGGATSLPANYLILGIEPYEQIYETSPTNERLNWVMSHELLHVVASDQAASMDRFFRKLLFGKVQTTSEAPLSMLYSYLASPRNYAPRWYHEGMAVFMETWMAGGYGRAIGGYDEMVFRTKVAENTEFWDVVGLESEGTTTDFQAGQVSYLYGTRFISYLAYTYGPETVLNWLNRTSGTRRDFVNQFKKIYGTSLDDEWAKWIDFEHEWQQTNLDSIRQYPLTEYRELTKDPIGSVSRSYFDPETRTLYAAVLYPGELAHITAIDVDTGERRKITEIPTPALYYVSSLAYDDSTGTVFYTTDNARYWRDLNAVDVKTGKNRRLHANIRTGDLAYDPVGRMVWGIQHHNGKSVLVAVPEPYETWAPIVPFPYGQDLFDIDVSPDGRYITGTLMEISGRQRLVRMNINQAMFGKPYYEDIYEFPKYSPANFVYSPDGKYLFGTTYKTGVSNVTRYNFETKEMEWITNSETGFFRPLPISEDSLIAYHYTSEGFKPVMIANEPIEDVAAIRFLGQGVFLKYPMLEDWKLPGPMSVHVDSVAMIPRDYPAWGEMRVRPVYPIVEDYKGRTAWGLRFNISDPMWVHAFTLSASYTPSESLPENERAHILLRYEHWPWEFEGSLNRAHFYDFFGPTKFARKGYSLGGQYSSILIHERPKRLEYDLRAAYYGDLETLPEYQNVLASFAKYLTVGAGLNFKSTRKTIGGVESERGILSHLDVVDNYVNKHHIFRYWGSFDYGFLLPWEHSSIWLRTAAGNSHGDDDEPFANFFFGGFGNNWVDYQDVSRYREHYSFPGIEINGVGGTTFGKFTLEWTMPPVRFRRLGIPNLYCNWAHLRLFSTALSTNLHNRPIRRTLFNVGAQIDFKVMLFWRMSTTLSIGYAGAWEKYFPEAFDASDEYHRFSDDVMFSDEFMISLKIL